MALECLDLSKYVHCRTGSLEKQLQPCLDICAVHCRTGSLEKFTFMIAASHSVHCRTGSLEKD